MTALHKQQAKRLAKIAKDTLPVTDNEEVKAIMEAQGEINEVAKEDQTGYPDPVQNDDLADGGFYRHRTFNPKGPKYAGQHPIAFITPQGTVYPMLQNVVSERGYLLGHNVTYIFDEDDLRKVLDANDKAREEGATHKILRGLYLKKAPLRAMDEAANRPQREFEAVAYDPSMLNGSFGAY